MNNCRTRARLSCLANHLRVTLHPTLDLSSTLASSRDDTALFLINIRHPDGSAPSMSSPSKQIEPGRTTLARLADDKGNKLPALRAWHCVGEWFNSLCGLFTDGEWVRGSWEPDGMDSHLAGPHCRGLGGWWEEGVVWSRRPCGIRTLNSTTQSHRLSTAFSHTAN